jgi:hypothetical protein
LRSVILRSVMKTGVFGQDAQQMVPSTYAGEEATYLRPNVVSVVGERAVGQNSHTIQRYE